MTAPGTVPLAMALAQHFQQVIATDASAAQIQSAVPHERIEYTVAPAEASELSAHSVDLILVAQAAHWLDMTQFNQEVKRVLRPCGVVALVGYQLCRSIPEVDELILASYVEELAQYWPPERALIDGAYAAIPLDFEHIGFELSAMSAQWQVDQFLGYLNTWSGARVLTP